jgi:hypothetical protein
MPPHFFCYYPKHQLTPGDTDHRLLRAVFCQFPAGGEPAAEGLPALDCQLVHLALQVGGTEPKHYRIFNFSSKYVHFLLLSSR